MTNPEKELHKVTIAFLVEGDFETAVSAATDVAEHIVEIANLTPCACSADTERITVKEAVEQFQYEEDEDEAHGTRTAG